MLATLQGVSHIFFESTNSTYLGARLVPNFSLLTTQHDAWNLLDVFRNSKHGFGMVIINDGTHELPEKT